MVFTKDEKSSLAEAANAAHIEFLLRDLDVAMTLIYVATTNRIEETAQRNRQNARDAYDLVVGQLSKVKLNASQQHSLDEKLAILKMRLNAVGQKFCPVIRSRESSNP